MSIPWNPITQYDGEQPGGRERLRHGSVKNTLSAVHLRNVIYELGLSVSPGDFALLNELNCHNPGYVASIMEYAKVNNCTLVQAQYDLALTSEPTDVSQDIPTAKKHKWIEIS